MKLEQLIYKPGDELIAYKNGEYLYTINGVSFGKLVKKKVFSKDGLYIGEFNFAGYLVSKNTSSKEKISPFTLPENSEKVPNKLMFIASTKKFGALAKPFFGGGSGEFNEFPNTEELEKLH